MATYLRICGTLIFGCALLVSPLVASEQDLRAGVDQLVEHMVKGVPEGQPLKVAVADFPDLQGLITDLGRFVANRLTTNLAQHRQRFIVVERQRLTQVLTELRFSMSDLVNPEKAKKLGQMVGVEAIVVGTISDLGAQVDLDSRMIEIETARTILGTTVTINKDKIVAEMLGRARELPGSDSKPAKSLGTAKFQEFPKFRVEVDGLQVLSEGEVVVVLNYINKSREELGFALVYPPHQKTFLLDDAGNRYHLQTTSGLSYEVGSPIAAFASPFGQTAVPMPLAPGATATVSLTFVFRGQGYEQHVKKGNLFSLSSEQALVKLHDPDVIRNQPRRSRLDPVREQKPFNISIRLIEPR